MVNLPKVLYEREYIIVLNFVNGPDNVSHKRSTPRRHLSLGGSLVKELRRSCLFGRDEPVEGVLCGCR